MIISKGCLVLDSTTQVYNFTVESCHNYFVGSTAVLVHNEHSGLLIWVKNNFPNLDAAKALLAPAIAAKVTLYIAELKKNASFPSFLGNINNPINKQKLDEFLDVIGRTRRYLPFEIDEVIKKLKKSNITYVLGTTNK